MFSGIVATIGRIRSVERREAGAVLTIDATFAEEPPALGESVATSGVCLTVREILAGGFVADLSAETLARTTLGRLTPGDPVNLERSLRVGDRISGHFVFGHVDGVGRVEAILPEGDGWRFAFSAPNDLARFLADKGSIAVDGISLTMCDCAGDTFAVAVIPHTYAVTTLGVRRPGDAVNLEADMLARYAQKALTKDSATGG